MKKGEPNKFRDGNKSEHESLSRDKDHPFQPLQNVIGEIRGNKDDRKGAIYRKVI